MQLQDSPFVIPSNWKAAEKGVVGSSSPTQARSGAPKLGKGVSSSLVNGTQSAGKYEIDIDWVVVNFLYSYYSENKQKVTDALVMDIAQSENVGVEQVAIRGVEPMRLFTPRSPKISLVETDSAAVAGADSERYMISGIRVFASIKVESETMAKMVARHLLSSIRDRTVSLTTLEDLPSASRGNDDLGFALDWNRSTVTYQGNLVSDHYGVEVANKALEMGKATNGATKSIQDYVNQLKKAIVQSGEVNDAILEATKLTDHCMCLVVCLFMCFVVVVERVFLVCVSMYAHVCRFCFGFVVLLPCLCGTEGIFQSWPLTRFPRYTSPQRTNGITSRMA